MLSRYSAHSFHLLPPVPATGQHHGDPDEDVDGVKGRGAIVGGVVLSLVDHFLGVVQQEGAEQDKATIDSDAVHASTQGGGGWQEVGGDAGTEDDAETHGQGAAHVEELVTGGAHGHSGQTTNHARSVPGRPGEDGPTKQTDGSNDSTHNCTVGKPGCLLGADSRRVGNAACDHAAADHGGDAPSHGDEAAPVHQVHGSRGAVDGRRGSCSGGQAGAKVEVSVPHAIPNILGPRNSPVYGTSLTGHSQPIERQGTQAKCCATSNSALPHANGSSLTRSHRRLH